MAPTDIFNSEREDLQVAFDELQIILTRSNLEGKSLFLFVRHLERDLSDWLHIQHEQSMLYQIDTFKVQLFWCMRWVRQILQEIDAIYDDCDGDITTALYRIYATISSLPKVAAVQY
jgi:hypothetical protein